MDFSHLQQQQAPAPAETSTLGPKIPPLSAPQSHKAPPKSAEKKEKRKKKSLKKGNRVRIVKILGDLEEPEVSTGRGKVGGEAGRAAKIGAASVPENAFVTPTPPS